MTNVKENMKGFTLIEVMIVTLIATMVIGTLTSSLMIMTKSYELNQDIVDMQYQAQVTLNTIVEEIKYSKGIVKVYSKVAEDDVSESPTIQDISMFCVKNNEDEYIYFKLEGDKLYYKQGVDGEVTYENLETSKEDLMATNIKTIMMTPLNGPFKETDSVNIALTFQERDAKLTVSNQATIRNKK